MARQLFVSLVILMLFGATLPIFADDETPTHPPTITAEVIITNLKNPRGVVALDDGRLIIAEAGLGDKQRNGQIRMFADLDGDGFYEDRQVMICCLGNYNGLTEFGTGQDEVGGVGSVIMLEDGRVFFTQDDPAEGYIADGRPRGIAVFGLGREPDWKRYEVVVRNATMNSLIYDPERDIFYVIESGLNRLSALTMDGKMSEIAVFTALADGQQSVPAAVARDPRHGDLYVALFSGQIRDYYDGVIAYMPERSQIIKLDPDTYEWEVWIDGLTTAVDLTIDEFGNIYVVEMATGWPPAPMNRDFPLFDADAPPDAGGYPRFSGRVTMFPVDGSEPIQLLQEIDLPTNITYHKGTLYVSVGQGTPGRSIIGPEGRTQITGQIIRITGFLENITDEKE
jgi:hypothetical protein